jgi:hypothetical protein
VTTLVLSDVQLVELADLVAERLAGRVCGVLPVGAATRRLVDANELAAILNVTPATVREHAADLGGVRIGDGARPRWRFDADLALTAWTARYTSESSHESKSPVSVGVRRRARRTSMGNGVALLPVRGRSSRGGDR